MMEIKVLGSGCSRCRELLANVREALAESGKTADVEYVTDMKRIMGYGVMGLPALVVDGAVVSVGTVLKAAEVEALLAGK